MILLSVHLITYNNEAFIEQTLNSILKQKCSFTYEIVVGDDCSTDKTLDIILDYNNRFPNLFNIKRNEKRLGILKNFKTTLDRCQGEYVFDIAGDDILKTEDALEKLVSAFSSNSSIGFVDSGYDRYYLDTNKKVSFVNSYSINCTKNDYINEIYLGKVIPVGICYKRSALYKNVDFDYFIKKDITIEDYPILMSLIKKTDFVRINESLHEYRIHNSSYSQKPNFERALLLRNQMLELFTFFKNKYNLSEELKLLFEENHHKSLLFLSAVHQNKDSARKSYNAIKNKTIRDRLHFFTSQYPLIYKLIRLRKIFT